MGKEINQDTFLPIPLLSLCHNSNFYQYKGRNFLFLIHWECLCVSSVPYSYLFLSSKYGFQITSQLQLISNGCLEIESHQLQEQRSISNVCHRHRRGKINYVCQVVPILSKSHYSYISASLYPESHKQFLNYPHKVTVKGWICLSQRVHRLALKLFLISSCMAPGLKKLME